MSYPGETQPTLRTLADCGYASIEEAFPPIDADQLGIHPLSNYLLVQMRLPKKTTASGIILTGDTQDFDQYQTMIGRVLDLGPIAFRDRSSLKPWDGFDWAAPGAFVYVPRYTNNSRLIQFEDQNMELRFVKDLDVIARLDSVAVRTLKAYI